MSIRSNHLRFVYTIVFSNPKIIIKIWNVHFKVYFLADE